MMATIIGSFIIAILVLLAIRHMVKSHKNGGCSGNCDGCSRCSIPADEVKKQISSQK